MANITQENINTLAQEISSLSNGDYIYVFKSGADGFSRIEKSVFMAGIQAGLSPDDIVDGLNSNDGTKALSAAQGAVLKGKINEVYQALQSIYESLGGSAFWGDKPPVGLALPALNWNSTMYTVTLSLDNSHIIVRRSGVQVSGSFQAEDGANVILTFDGAPGYELSSVTVNNTAVTKIGNVFTYSFTVSAATTLAIDGVTIVVTSPITVTKTLNGCTYQESTQSPRIGGSYSITVTPPTGKSISNVSATMEGGGTISSEMQGRSAVISTSEITGDITIVISVTTALEDGSFSSDYGYAHSNPSSSSYNANWEDTGFNEISLSGWCRNTTCLEIPSEAKYLLWVFGALPGSYTLNTANMTVYNSDKASDAIRAANNRTGYRNLGGRGDNNGWDTYEAQPWVYLRGSYYKSALTTAITIDGQDLYPGLYYKTANGTTWQALFDASQYSE